MLSRKAILRGIETGHIEVTPLVRQHIGPNSIDLRLGATLKSYHPIINRIEVQDPVSGGFFHAIDPANPPPLVDVPKVLDAGYPNHWLLVPGMFYLGVTMEETYTRGFVACIDGRSTCGRLSIEAHKTAGVGDNGFRGRWTLEIEATEPVLVAPGDRLFQVYFEPCWAVWMAEPDKTEQHDLYGGDQHHYQNSQEVRGAIALSSKSLDEE